MKIPLAPRFSHEHSVGLAELARLRQGCYRFFGAMFLYPDEGRLADLAVAARDFQGVSESLAAFPFFGPWKRLLAALPRVAGRGSARVEGNYVRLFLVNPAAPLYESFYLDPGRQATGWITAQLAGEYAERGLVLSRSLREPPDHAAVELEFMAYLCSLEAQAWEDASSSEGIRTLRWQLDFLGKHLGHWFSAFIRQVAEADPEGLYAIAAEAAGAFIHHDRDLVAVLLERSRAVEGP